MLKEQVLKEQVEQEWVDYPTAERYSGLSHTTLWRYVSSGELKAALERRRDQAERRGGTPAARASVSTYTPLDDPLAEMRRALLGDETATLAAAMAREQQALSVELVAGNLASGARSSAQAWANRSGSRGAYA